MKRLILACALAAATGAFAAADTSIPCAKDPAARGLAERIDNIKRQMDRIEWTTDRAEQRALMDLHMKTMHEGLRELRRRHTGDECRMEMMHAMMEQMLRHQLAAAEVGR